MFAIVLLVRFQTAQCFPSRGEGDVVLLGAGAAVTPPSPDLVQQADALEKSGNQAIMAGSQAAAADVESNNAEAAATSSQSTMVIKAADSGADPAVVATQAASQADPSEVATTGPDQDSAAEVARSRSVSRSQDINDEAIDSQRREEKDQLTKAVPSAAAAVEEQSDPDGPCRSSACAQDAARAAENTPTPDENDGLPGYHKLAPLTVPDQNTALTRMQGSLRHCQDACNTATLCTGIEYSKENGGVCILLRHGIHWSNTFEYYDKDTPESSDPVRISKHDHKLMWGKLSERSHDLGGLAMNDVPGATLYKPPSTEKMKEKAARHVIKEMDRPVEVERVHAATAAKAKLQAAKMEQTHAVLVESQTQDIAKAVKQKQQHLLRHDAQANMHAAKLSLSAARMSAKASKQLSDYAHMASQAHEYQKAASAFADAGNPMATGMKIKAAKWTAKAAHLKELGTKAKAKADIEKMQAKMAMTDAKHWEQQTEWASVDERRAQEQLSLAENNKLSADETLSAKMKLNKDAEWNANCHPLCNYDFNHPSIYRPKPVKTNPAIASVQYEYEKQKEWQYSGKPTPPTDPTQQPTVVTDSPSELATDNGVN